MSKTDKKKEPSEKEILAWAGRAEFRTGDPWESIRARLNEPEPAEAEQVRPRAGRRSRRLVLAANLALLTVIGVLVAGLTGLVRFPGSGGKLTSEEEIRMLASLGTKELSERGEIVFDCGGQGYNLEKLIAYFSADPEERPAYLRTIRFGQSGEPHICQVTAGKVLRIDSFDRIDSSGLYGRHEVFQATYEHIGTVDIYINIPSRLFILYNGELPTEDELRSQNEDRWSNVASVPLSELGEP